MSQIWFTSPTRRGGSGGGGGGGGGVEDHNFLKAQRLRSILQKMVVGALGCNSLL